MDQEERIIRLVKQQVVPAIGCTEPMCVSLCVARAAEALGEEPVSVRVARRLRFSEVDALAIAWHGGYPRFFEDAHTELMRKLGLTYEHYRRHGYGAPVVQCHVDYFEPLLLDEELPDFVAEGTPYACHFQAVGKPVVDEDITRKREYLRLVLQPSEGGGEDEPVIIPLELRAVVGLEKRRGMGLIAGHFKLSP